MYQFTIHNVQPDRTSQVRGTQASSCAFQAHLPELFFRHRSWMPADVKRCGKVSFAESTNSTLRNNYPERVVSLVSKILHSLLTSFANRKFSLTYIPDIETKMSFEEYD